MLIFIDQRKVKSVVGFLQVFKIVYSILSDTVLNVMPTVHSCQVR